MPGPIWYNFEGLSQGHASMMGGNSAFDDLSTQWKGQVSSTAQTWLSQDGVDFTVVNEVLKQAETQTNDFLARLAMATQNVNMNAQDTLTQCRTIVNRT